MIYLIGMKLSDAMRKLSEEKIEFRLSNIDGVAQILTQDLHLERYNLTVVNDKITNVNFG